MQSYETEMTPPLFHAMPGDVGSTVGNEATHAAIMSGVMLTGGVIGGAIIVVTGAVVTVVIGAAAIAAAGV